MQRRVVLLLAVSILALPKLAHAILGIADTAIVNDPLHTFQGTLTAARTLVSNQQEARMILQNAESLVNQAKSLTALPLSVVNEIQAAMDSYTRLVMDGRSTIGEIRGMVEQFESLYASGWQGNLPLFARAKGLLEKVRQAGAIATQADALYDRLKIQHQTTNRLLVASKAAPGPLAAQQATNELLGTLGTELASMQTLLAAQGEMHKAWILTHVVGAEAASAQGQTQQIDVTKYLPARTLVGTGPRLPR
jgi:P-type conjugative transfer protein TrbJ